MYFTSACLRMCIYVPWNVVSCPQGHILLNLVLCSGTDRPISVRSSQELPRTDVQHSVTQRQSHRTCLALSVHFRPGKLGMLWQSCLQLRGWALCDLGHWYSTPGQSAWSSTTPSVSRLSLEGTDSKAQDRYKLTLQSSAIKVTPGLGVSLETTGFQF